MPREPIMKPSRLLTAVAIQGRRECRASISLMGVYRVSTCVVDRIASHSRRAGGLMVSATINGEFLLRRLTSILAASVFGIAGIALTPAAAQAYPTDCSAWIGNLNGYPAAFATCTGGTGSYRAEATCRRPNGSTYKVYSWWARAHSNTTVGTNCTAGQPVVKASAGVSNS